MNYSTAIRRFQAESLVYYQGHHWRIMAINKLTNQVSLLMDGDYKIVDAPLKEVRE